MWSCSSNRRPARSLDSRLFRQQGAPFRLLVLLVLRMSFRLVQQRRSGLPQQSFAARQKQNAAFLRRLQVVARVRKTRLSGLAFSPLTHFDNINIVRVHAPLIGSSRLDPDGDIAPGNKAVIHDRRANRVRHGG